MVAKYYYDQLYTKCWEDVPFDATKWTRTKIKVGIHYNSSEPIEEIKRLVRAKQGNITNTFINLFRPHSKDYHTCHTDKHEQQIVFAIS